MAISISPTEILRLFRDHGIQSRLAVADYLDHIASSASSLANYWAEFFKAFPMESPGGISIRELTLLMRHSNWAPYYETSEYYVRASDVLGGKLTEFQMNDLFNALGRLLETRNQTQKLHVITKNGLDADRMEEIEGSVTIQELGQMVEAMQQEAAKLRVLAATVRAKS